MQIDLGSENQVLNGSSSSTCPILIVHVMLCLPVNLFLIQDILVGGTIERWEDPFLRKCFENIFNSNWRDHDSYSLEGCLDRESIRILGNVKGLSRVNPWCSLLSMHSIRIAAWMLEVLFMADRDSLASSEHSKDGSLWGDLIDAMVYLNSGFFWPMIQSSETAPTQGTLYVYPDVLLSNAYIILRPFFSPTVLSNSKDIYDANNWKFGRSCIIILQYLT